jgi:hypothetical protein
MEIGNFVALTPGSILLGYIPLEEERVRGD